MKSRIKNDPLDLVAPLIAFICVFAQRPFYDFLIICGHNILPRASSSLWPLLLHISDSPYVVCKYSFIKSVCQSPFDSPSHRGIFWTLHNLRPPIIRHLPSELPEHLLNKEQNSAYYYFLTDNCQLPRMTPTPHPNPQTIPIPHFAYRLPILNRLRWSVTLLRLLNRIFFACRM